MICLRLIAVALLGLSACGVGETLDGPVEEPIEPWFEEVSGELGLDFRHRSGAAGELLFPEIMSGGVALLDADLDGDLDIFFVQGAYRRDEAPGELWRNDGGRFSRVEPFLESSSGDPSSNTVSDYGMGVAAGDVDADGDVDLFVTSAGRDRLLLNETVFGEVDISPAIRFVDATDAGFGGETGASGDAWSSSAGFFDADADGDLDLFVTRYVRWSPASDLDCAAPSGGPDYCSPLSYSAPLPDLLFRNDGPDAAGRPIFREISSQAGLRRSSGNGLGLAFLDLDQDQDLDVFVANDQTANHLWRNLGDGRFEDVAAEMGVAVGPSGQARAGMGVATADLDDDGDQEILVVNLERQADALLQNEGAFFRDVTGARGLGTVSRALTRFGAVFGDFDLDGSLDLFLANGRVTRPAGSSTAAEGDPFAEPNLLFAGDASGRFQPRPVLEPNLSATSRAAAGGDLDGDGRLDLVVANRDGPAHVLRNVRPGHWLLLDLVNSPGRTAVGTRVGVRVGDRTLYRFVSPASSYQSSHDPRLHFGLGSAADLGEVVVEVQWPDGTLEDFGPLAVDRVHVIRRTDP